MVKKAEKTQSKSVATMKEACTPCRNPVVGIAKIIAIAVLLVTVAFLLWGQGTDIVYSIPISMGLILLGIVLAILAVRKTA